MGETSESTASGPLLDGRYRLVAPMARGGMSIVWRGQDELLGRPVAIKVLNIDSSDTDLAERVRREAKAVARLSHPHVATVFDYGESTDVPRAQGRPPTGPTPYIVMELVEGESLARVLKRGPLIWPTAVGICAQVASALATAHQYGVVHRDITPSNIMIATDGVKVIDFGVAAEAGDRTDGAIYGTPAYLAPERLFGGIAQAATDVYGLGIVLYESLTGRLPWSAGTTNAMITAHQYVPPAPIPYIEGLPEQVAHLCGECLSVEPSRRPSSGQAHVVLAEAARLGDRRTAAARMHPANRGAFGSTTTSTRVVSRFAHEPVDSASNTVRLDERGSGPETPPRRHRRDRGMFFLPALLMIILIGCLGLSELRFNGGRLIGPNSAPSRTDPQTRPQTGDGGDRNDQAEPQLPVREKPQTSQTSRALAEAPNSSAATALCTYQYETTGTWAFGYAAVVTISNTSTTTVAGWTLTFRLPSGQQVTDGFIGQWEQSGNKVTVVDSGQDATMSPGDSTTVGFLARNRDGGGGSSAPATDFRLNGHACAGA